MTTPDLASRLDPGLWVVLASPFDDDLALDDASLERVVRASEQVVGDAALDVAEEARIAAEPAEHRGREEDAEERAPHPRIPLALVPAKSLVRRAVDQQLLDLASAMHERQHARPERLEVALELPCRADASLDLG